MKLENILIGFLTGFFLTCFIYILGLALIKFRLDINRDDSWLNTDKCFKAGIINVIAYIIILTLIFIILYILNLIGEDILKIF